MHIKELVSEEKLETKLKHDLGAIILLFMPLFLAFISLYLMRNELFILHAYYGLSLPKTIITWICILLLFIMFFLMLISIKTVLQTITLKEEVRFPVKDFSDKTITVINEMDQEKILYIDLLTVSFSKQADAPVLVLQPSTDGMTNRTLYLKKPS